MPPATIAKVASKKVDPKQQPPVAKVSSKKDDPKENPILTRIRREDKTLKKHAEKAIELASSALKLVKELNELNEAMKKEDPEIEPSFVGANCSPFDLEDAENVIDLVLYRAIEAKKST